MASMRDIKRRRESIQSTQQITKAMKLVSTVKLQRAKARAERSKPYFGKVFATILSIMSKSEAVSHPYLDGNGAKKKALIVITSNRGLAGGYNNNLIRTIADSGLDREDVVVYGIGRKGIEGLTHRGFRVTEDDSDVINDPLFSDAAAIGKKVLDAFNAGEIGEIYLAYTFFKNTVVHEPRLLKLLPVDAEGILQEDMDLADQSARAVIESTNAALAGKDRTDRKDTGDFGETEGTAVHSKEGPMNFEPEPEETLNQLIPNYINITIYGGLIEAVASENGARMQAMDAATSNADEMIANLSLAYNRARQGAITQELTEIISGAEALN